MFFENLSLETNKNTEASNFLIYRNLALDSLFSTTGNDVAIYFSSLTLICWKTVSEEVLQQLIERLEETAAGYGMEISSGQLQFAFLSLLLTSTSLSQNVFVESRKLL